MRRDITRNNTNSSSNILSGATLFCSWPSKKSSGYTTAAHPDILCPRCKPAMIFAVWWKYARVCTISEFKAMSATNSVDCNSFFKTCRTRPG